MDHLLSKKKREGTDNLANSLELSALSKVDRGKYKHLGAYGHLSRGLTTGNYPFSLPLPDSQA